MTHCNRGRIYLISARPTKVYDRYDQLLNGSQQLTNPDKSNTVDTGIYHLTKAMVFADNGAEFVERIKTAPERKNEKSAFKCSESSNGF